MEQREETAYTDRRKSLRLDMEHHMVAIFWHDQHQELQSKQVVCVDVCNGGISLDLDRPLAIGTEISVMLEPGVSPKRQAKVLRCSQQDTGWFLVGLFFIK